MEGRYMGGHCRDRAHRRRVAAAPGSARGVASRFVVRALADAYNVTNATAGTQSAAWAGDPSLADVLAARDFLAAHLAPTPLVRREAVCSALGLDVWLKCESLLPTAAFKVRGGLNLIGRDPTAKAGVMGASTGNHGQSLAYAGRVFSVPVTIVVPKGANPLKIAAMRANGATIVEHGSDDDDRRAECERR